MDTDDVFEPSEAVDVGPVGLVVGTDSDGIIVEGPVDVRVEEGVDASDDPVAEVVVVDSIWPSPFVEVVSSVWPSVDAAEEVVLVVTPLEDVVEEVDELPGPEVV